VTGRGPRTPGSPGYTLVAILVFLAILSISIMAVSPLIYKVMQREREEELIFRGKQYALAIQTFQKLQGRPPLNLKELMKTRPRSARKLWKDPMCGCDDWGLIREGQPWPAPQNQKGAGGSELFPSLPGAPGGSPSTTTRPPLPSTYGAPPDTGHTLPSTYGSPPPGGGGPGGGARRPGTPGAPASGGGAGFSNDALFKNSSGEHSNVPIIGVYSKVHKKGIRTFRGQEYYDQWGFIAGQNNDENPLLNQLGNVLKTAPKPKYPGTNQPPN
jgi:type II secretory pathway pseudopilin PulG